MGLVGVFLCLGLIFALCEHPFSLLWQNYFCAYTFVAFVTKKLAENILMAFVTKNFRGNALVAKKPWRNHASVFCVKRTFEVKYPLILSTSHLKSRKICTFGYLIQILPAKPQNSQGKKGKKHITSKFFAHGMETAERPTHRKKPTQRS